MFATTFLFATKRSVEGSEFSNLELEKEPPRQPSQPQSSSIGKVLFCID
jgi:hypothetical protein